MLHLRERLDHLVHLATSATLVIQETMDHQVLLLKLVLPDQLVHLDRRVKLAKLVGMATAETTEVRDNKDHRVRKENQALMDNQAHRVSMAHQERTHNIALAHADLRRLKLKIEFTFAMPIIAFYKTKCNMYTML